MGNPAAPYLKLPRSTSKLPTRKRHRRARGQPPPPTLDFPSVLEPTGRAVAFFEARGERMREQPRAVGESPSVI